jgi:hypothetical protein
MQPLLPEKESGNGTGATSLAQAKYKAVEYPSNNRYFWAKRRTILVRAAHEHSPEQRFSLPFRLCLTRFMCAGRQSL